ncbi:hypothetical protein V8C37DRAFT_396369 [Trichoderma ceciliae]
MSDLLQTADLTESATTNPNTLPSGEPAVDDPLLDNSNSISHDQVARSGESAVNDLLLNNQSSISHNQAARSGESAANDLLLDNSNSISHDQVARSGESAVNDPQSDDQNSVSSGRVSNLSRSRYYDIQSTWSPKVDIKWIDARACWYPGQDIDISLDIRWGPQHAFLKLRKPLSLEAAPGTSGGHRKAYIFIHPERISQLSFTAEPKYIPFGYSTIAFTFHLNKPPALIRPKKHIRLTQEAENAILSLQSLVQQSKFTIYASLSSRRTSHGRLQKFCEDVTKHKFATMESQANWTSLYPGGADEAEFIEGDSLLDPVINWDDAAALELPAYQEIEPSILLTRSAKRKRSCEENSTIGENVQDIVAVRALIGNILDTKLVAHVRKLEEIFSVHEHKLEEKLSAYEHAVKEMISTHKRDVEEVEDRLRETIKEEMYTSISTVKKSVLETITSKSLQATLTFSTHLFLDKEDTVQNII